MFSGIPVCQYHKSLFVQIGVSIIKIFGCYGLRISPKDQLLHKTNRVHILSEQLELPWHCNCFSFELVLKNAHYVLSSKSEQQQCKTEMHHCPNKLNKEPER